MIRTIIFDLGGVIVPLDFPRAYAAIAKHCSLPAPEIQRKVLETGLVDELECGRVDPQEFARVVIDSLKMKVDYEQFGELWGELFPPHTLIQDEVFAALKQNHRLLLMSNTNAIHFPYILRHYPVLQRFDYFVLSYEVGVMKPDRRIYDEAIKHAECAAEECLFIDDVQENVDGARAAGMRSERFEGVEKLRRDLAALGVRI
jgi:putative hydrolase of the HAD superfamily